MTPASAIVDYVRLLELQGKATGTPLIYGSSSTAPRTLGLKVDTAHLWSRRYPLTPRNRPPRGIAVRALEARADVAFNSAFPQTDNDGAAWAGRGVSGIVRGGAEIVWGPLTARLYPSVMFAENREFTLGVGPGSVRSPYAHPWRRDIDFPQRFGDAAVTALDWGQSGIRLDLKAFTAGFSTENLWWGPGSRNAITMSNAAAGFPHLDLGTGRPLHTKVGDFEFRGLWGQLEASQYTGAPATEGRRFITGLTAGYRPAALPGLTVGVTRVLYQRWPAGGPEAADLFGTFGGFFNKGGRVLEDGGVANDLSDQLASLVARWVFPEVGFEVYLEYARNDFAGDLRDLFLQPDLARGYTAGFQKSLVSSRATWSLKGETTNLAAPAIAALRGVTSFYAHGINPEGYTNRGQLLGATIGPGSNAQYLGLDRYTDRGRAGIYVARIRYDDDYSVAALPDVEAGYLSQQADVTTGVSMLRFGRVVDWGGGLELTREFNRYFDRWNDFTNLRLSLTLSWH